MKKLLPCWWVLLMLIVIPAESFGWGQNGHRVVGQIANDYISKRVKRKIASILGNENIAMASNWPDFIKSDTSKKYLDPWHYVNLAPGLSYDSIKNFLETDAGPNIYTQINLLVAELKNDDLPLEKKQFNLKFLIHLIGDLHQPMHVGHLSDRGGNDIKVKWFSTATNLHRVWDEDFIGFQQLSYTEFAASINFTTKEQRKEIASKPLAQWVFESYQVAQQLYADITEPDQRLDYKYNFKYQALLQKQLLEGGVHLASVLNDIFG